MCTPLLAYLWEDLSNRPNQPETYYVVLTMTSCALSPAQDQIGHQLDLLKVLLNEKIGKK